MLLNAGKLTVLKTSGPWHMLLRSALHIIESVTTFCLHKHRRQKERIYTLYTVTVKNVPSTQHPLEQIFKFVVNYFRVCKCINIKGKYIYFLTEGCSFHTQRVAAEASGPERPNSECISWNMPAVLLPSCANINFLLKQPLACESKFAQSWNINYTFLPGRECEALIFTQPIKMSSELY